MQKSAGKGNTSLKLSNIWAPKWNIHCSNVIVFCEQIQIKYNDDDDYDDVNIKRYLVEINPECQTHLLRSCTQFSHHVVQIYYFIHFTFIWYPNLPQGRNRWNQIKMPQRLVSTPMYVILYFFYIRFCLNPCYLYSFHFYLHWTLCIELDSPDTGIIEWTLCPIMKVRQIAALL